MSQPRSASLQPPQGARKQGARSSGRRLPLRRHRSRSFRWESPNRLSLRTSPAYPANHLSLKASPAYPANRLLLRTSPAYPQNGESAREEGWGLGKRSNRNSFVLLDLHLKYIWKAVETLTRNRLPTQMLSIKKLPGIIILSIYQFVIRI